MMAETTRHWTAGAGHQSQRSGIRLACWASGAGRLSYRRRMRRLAARLTALVCHYQGPVDAATLLLLDDHRWRPADGLPCCRARRIDADVHAAARQASRCGDEVLRPRKAVGFPRGGA